MITIMPAHHVDGSGCYESKAIVLGVSAGGMDALKAIIPKLPKTLNFPIFIVQHIRKDSGDFLAEFLNKISEVTVQYVMDKEVITSGHVYIAPAGYHLLVERDYTLSLSMDEKVNFARPSIDVLFDSAALVYRDGLTAVVLTGANSDGTNGARMVKKYGGVVVVQDPATAEAPVMPQSVIDEGLADSVLALDDVASFLVSLIR